MNHFFNFSMAWDKNQTYLQGGGSGIDIPWYVIPIPGLAAPRTHHLTLLGSFGWLPAHPQCMIPDSPPTSMFVIMHPWKTFDFLISCVLKAVLRKLLGLESQKWVWSSISRLISQWPHPGPDQLRQNDTLSY